MSSDKQSRASKLILDLCFFRVLKAVPCKWCLTDVSCANSKYFRVDVKCSQSLFASMKDVVSLDSDCRSDRAGACRSIADDHLHELVPKTLSALVGCINSKFFVGKNEDNF